MTVNPRAANLADDFVDTAAERSLIAAVARQASLYWELIDRLPEGAFAAEASAWAALTAAVQDEKPWPVPDGWVPATSPRETADQLADLWRRRQIAGLLQDVAGPLNDPGKPATETLALLEEELTRVQAAVRDARVGQAVPIPDLFAGLLDQLEKRRQAMKDGAAAVGVATGIAKLDKLLGGLQTGLHLLAASPGKGKTSLALQLAAEAARAGEPALFVTFEEAPERLALKVVCQQAGLVAKIYAEGYGDPQDVEAAMREHGPTLALLHVLEGTGNLTAGEVKARALAMMARHGVGRCLVVIDYLQRWAGGRREYTEFRHVVGGLVSELRELALRLDSPILVISSQNRPGQDGASLTSFKESGDLEYSCDSAMFLVDAPERSAVPPARAVDLKIQKNRYGDIGKVALIFRADLGVMREEGHT